MITRSFKPIWSRTQHTANQFVSKFGSCDIKHARYKATIHQSLHRPPTRARGMKNKHFVTTLFQILASLCNTWCSDAKHGRTHQRLYTGRGLETFIYLFYTHYSSSDVGPSTYGDTVDP